MPDPLQLPDDLTVLERGWLSSNNVLVHGTPGEPAAALVDSGHCVHAAQTVALVRHALAPGEALARLVNTHLHSDHCGGNAALAAAFGDAVPIDVPPGGFDAVRRWDVDALGYRPTGQRCERFAAHGMLAPGTRTRLGARHWDVLAAPGHDPHAVMLFDAVHGVLISGDALWERGFGVVFPELEGESGFDEVEAVLEVIEALPVAAVIPGHGRPFADLPAALARARKRLARYRADPPGHATHAAKVLLKYHLMEQGREPLAEVLAWAAQGAPLFASIWRRSAQAQAASPEAWARTLLAGLAEGGALRIEGGMVHDLARAGG